MVSKVQMGNGMWSLFKLGRALTPLFLFKEVTYVLRLHMWWQKGGFISDGSRTFTGSQQFRKPQRTFLVHRRTIYLKEFLPRPDILTTIISEFSLLESLVRLSGSPPLSPSAQQREKWTNEEPVGWSPSWSLLVSAGRHLSQCDGGDTREERGWTSHWLIVWIFTS